MTSCALTRALVFGCLALVSCTAFVTNPTNPPFLSDKTSLQLAKRRGKLGSLVDAGDSVSKTSRTVPKKRSKRVNKKNSAGSTKKSSKDNNEASTISPLLQEWASGQKTEQEEDPAKVEDSGSAASFSRFDSKKNKRASSKSGKQSQDAERNAQVLKLVEELEDVITDLEENNKKTADINDILEPIRQLMAMPNANTNLRQLTAGNTRHNYRLTWVGSDAAICHVGTGLHNVPLARLQEVFLSLVGKSRLEVLEVIRIIGPFPNVRNTLEGTCTIGKKNLVCDGGDVSELGISYEFMIDGTGKTIAAGTQDNVRRLQLHVAFCDENAIVAVVPPEEGGVRDDPLQDNGANVLFFAREETLDEKLDALRVL